MQYLAVDLVEGQKELAFGSYLWRCAGSGSRDGPVQPQKRNNRPAF